MSEIISASPFRCRIWSEHVRLEENLSEVSCQNEIESLRAHGQLIPALARRIHGDGLHDFEVVCGARRLFATRHLNIPLKIELRELTDREAAIALDVENNHRQNLSQYERARGYARWLKAGMFASQDELARDLRISKAQLSRILSLAKLPSVIVNAFESPLDICETWGPELYSAWRDARKQPPMATTARKLAQSRPKLSAPQIFEALIAGSMPDRKARPKREHVVKDAQGRPLFRVRFGARTAAILIPEPLMSDEFDKITQALVAALRDSAIPSTPRSATSVRRGRTTPVGDSDSAQAAASA